MRHSVKQSGFSLLELILVIVLLGVLASGAGLLITQPIGAYNAQLRRQQLVDQAEMAMRQIARDIRKALPNSIRVGGGGTALEMVNTVDGARYRDEAGGAFTASNDILNFSSGDTDFNLLGQFTRLTAFAGDHRLVIYNTAPSNIYLDVTANNNPGIVTPSAANLTLSLNAGEHHINISSAFQFSQQSPGQRTFVIDGAISYVCNSTANSITRYDSYDYQLTQSTSDVLLAALPNVESGRVVSRLSGCNISYDAGTAQRGGIVTIEITLTDAGESISLLHQVHVVNVP